MAKNVTKKKLEKKDYVNTFSLTGKVVVDDYTFTMEKVSDSGWCYNKMNLAVDCGEKYGKIYAQMMGGYGQGRDNFVYAMGKKEDGSLDASNKLTIDWEDRLDADFIKEVADISLIKVGITHREDDETKLDIQSFLSAYDAIDYLHDNLENGMVVNVRGNIKYQYYNGNTTMQREITHVFLSNAEPKDFIPSFTQTFLMTKDSRGKVDKDKLVIPINAKVLDYIKELNGVTIKGFVPFARTFEIAIDLEKKALVEKLLKYLEVKKGVTQTTWDGVFIEGGATVKATEDDIPEDIKELIDMELMTLEEALATCSDNSTKERRMVITKPHVRKITLDDGTVKPQVQTFSNRYTEEDLIVDAFVKALSKSDEDEESEEEVDEEVETTEEATEEEEPEVSDDYWLNSLG